MKNTLIVVADLGSFKAFLTDEDESHSTPRLQALQEFSNDEAHSKRGNTLTVMEGRSAKNGGNPAANPAGSDGEQHNMHLEKRRRAIQQIARNSQDLFRRVQVDRCFLAAPEEILDQVLSALPPQNRALVAKALPLDLTRVDKAGLVQHFYGAAADGAR